MAELSLVYSKARSTQREKKHGSTGRMISSRCTPEKNRPDDMQKRPTFLP